MRITKIIREFASYALKNNISQKEKENFANFIKISLIVKILDTGNRLLRLLDGENTLSNEYKSEIQIILANLT